MAASDRTVLLERTREVWRRHAVDQQRRLDETCHLLALLVSEGEWSAQDVLAVAVAGGREGWPTQLLAVCVEAARRQGASWREVGAAFGVSRQAAHQRFVLADGPIPTAKDPSEGHHDEHRVDRQGAAADGERVTQAALDRLAALRVGRRRTGRATCFDGFTGETPARDMSLWWEAPGRGDVPIQIYQLAVRSLSVGQKAYAVRLLRLIDDNEQLGQPARRLLAQLEGKETGVRRGSEGDWR